jgi:GTPase involved in cell partitioning and DNA repair
MKFVDEVKIFEKAGDGNGCISFRENVLSYGEVERQVMEEKAEM